MNCFFCVDRSFFFSKGVRTIALSDFPPSNIFNPNPYLYAGDRGAICEEYDNSQYEVEFTNSDGESIALVVLSVDSFVVVWRSASKTWVPIAEKIQAIVSTLPEENRSKVFDFARSVHNEQISV